jgi:hypothetical protein
LDITRTTKRRRRKKVGRRSMAILESARICSVEHYKDANVNATIARIQMSIQSWEEA